MFQKVKDCPLSGEAFWNVKDYSVIITCANELDMELTNTKLIITCTNCSPKNSLRNLLNLIKYLMCES